MLEAAAHESNSFVTLTYAEDRRDLCPSDLQKWLKRYRKRLAPRRIRIYAVGEYGDIGGRPHYHAAVFGGPTCELNAINIRGECQCKPCSDVRETWGFGFVRLARLETASAAYIAKYVMKKLTRMDDGRLFGRYPEFSRMSLRPGIGAGVAPSAASDVMRWKLEEIPFVNRSEKKKFPFGRYIRRKIAEEITNDPERVRALLGAKRAAEEGRAELQLVRKVAWDVSTKVSEVWKAVNGGSS